MFKRENKGGLGGVWDCGERRVSRHEDRAAVCIPDIYRGTGDEVGGGGGGTMKGQ